jgi:hypothetical protein
MRWNSAHQILVPAGNVDLGVHWLSGGRRFPSRSAYLPPVPPTSTFAVPVPWMRPLSV